MSSQLSPRALARQDIDPAIDEDLSEAGEKTALAFITSLQRAYQHVSRHPATGSPRYVHELDLPNLRSWSLRRSPCLVFYVERDDRIDVWRVLHGRREVPAWIQEPVSTHEDACP